MAFMFKIFSRIAVAFITLAMISGCTTQQLADFGRILEGASEAPLTTAEVDAGLREALIQGISVGADEVSKVGGYLNNPQIRIPFPPEVVRVENTLRDIGMGSLVDQFVATLNRGAEEAAKEAKPVFIAAIRQMTIQDAFAILRGKEDEATQFLRRTTTGELTQRFSPIISQALDKTEATKYYGDIVSTYNAIPFVQQVNPDLTGYATERAIDGLFVMIAREERKIRKDPVARTTEILKRVFGSPEAQG